MIGLGLNLEKIQNEVEALIGRGQEQLGTPAYTPRAKKVIELSMDEARKLGHTYVGHRTHPARPIREGEGVAAQVLNNLGASLNKARQQVVQLLGSSEAVSSSQTGSSGGQDADPGQFGPRFDGQLAREGKLDPVIGREKEIERVIQVLSRRTKNNPVLIGEPGVGKTAIAEGLAQRIVDGRYAGDPEGQTGHDPGLGNAGGRFQIPGRI